MPLREDILTAIAQAVTTFHQNDSPPIPSAELDAEIIEHQYAYLLGLVAVEQNPYAKPAELDLPTEFPLGTAETRRIRKAGVLREFHAAAPLPKNRPIPAGPIFPFTYESLESLEDVAGAGESQGATNNDSVNKVDLYPHNIVKIVRIRYGLANRKFVDQAGNERISRAWLLLLYSGGDGP